MSKRKERCETCRFWNRLTDATCANGPIFLVNTTEQYKDLADALVRHEKALEGEGYISGDPQVEAGECRRLPPVIDSGSRGHWPNRHEGVFPFTLPLTWCGEYQPANAPTPVIVADKPLWVEMERAGLRQAKRGMEHIYQRWASQYLAYLRSGCTLEEVRRICRVDKRNSIKLWLLDYAVALVAAERSSSDSASAPSPGHDADG